MKMLAIVGPTASGKTGLSLKVATKFNGEIIAADSRTVYKGMDIGTAKPTVKEQKLVKHFCLDIVDPDSKFTVADYVKEAEQAKKDILGRGKLPIVVGGSGLFIDAFIYEYSFINTNEKLRKEYETYTVPELKKAIIEKKLALPNNHLNKRHLVNALIRNGTSGTKKHSLPDDVMLVGINPPKDDLVRSITIRAEQMFGLGIGAEAKVLYANYDSSLNAFNGGVYKYLPMYLKGELSKEDLIKLIVSSDLKLAKKQITWFKRNQEIIWFDSPNDAWHWLQSTRLDRI